MFKNMKIAAHTLGCKVNQYETEAVLEQFLNKGFTAGSFDEPCDVYLINTCTVTGMSDKKSRQMIRKPKLLNEAAIVVVMGCYAQTAEEEIKKIDGVDLIVGTSRRNELYNMVEDFAKNRQKMSFVSDIKRACEFEELGITHYENRTRAYLKVQDGCNRYCSYCIIPYARGPIRSRSIESTVNEAKRLAKNGFVEIVLVGIHLASYGLENKKSSLLELVQCLSEVEGIERIRLSSLEPVIFTDEFADGLSKIPKLCRHFHLSLQSGCDETLKRMNRRYTAEEYEKTLGLIREKMPDCAITTDIIAGFPMESDEEFEKTYKFIQKIKLAEAHIFKYSKREGTRAAQMEGQIPPEIKEIRSKRLIALSKRQKAEFLSAHINTREEVLFEQIFADDNSYAEGKTKNYITVIVKGGEGLLKKTYNVRLREIKNDVIIGEIE